MYKHILVATDGSELSRKAVTNGIQLAKALGARITTVTVAKTQFPVVVEGIEIGPSAEERAQSAKEQAARILNEASAEARRQGVKCETVSAIDEHPHRTIIDAAEARGCDLIVMASHGRRGIKALLLGSETQKVLTHSKVPVLIVR